MKKQTTKKDDRFFLQPYDMEEKNAYFRRFIHSRQMKEIMPDHSQRIKKCHLIFEQKKKEATVTIKKADGQEFLVA